MENINQELQRYFQFVSNRKENSLETLSELLTIAKRISDIVSSKLLNDISDLLKERYTETILDLLNAENIYKRYADTLNINLIGDSSHFVELNNLIYNSLEGIIYGVN